LPPSLTYPLTIKQPKTQADRLTTLLDKASKALLDEDFETALSLLQETASPNDPRVLNGSALALIGLKRFREAAVILERFLPTPEVARESLVPQTLAMVYFALGEDAKAQDILRKYLRPEQVGEVTTRLRLAGARARNR
jgi:Flp pilus assembly protein TadD